MLGREKRGEKALFDSAFDFFKGLAKTNVSPRFAQDFLPALGWGDISLDATGKRAFCIGYPWTRYWKDTTYPILRGMLSGIASASSKKDVVFGKAQATISSGSLDITMRGE